MNDPTGFCGTLQVINKVTNVNVHSFGHLVPTLPPGHGQVIVASKDFQKALSRIKYGANSRVIPLICIIR